MVTLVTVSPLEAREALSICYKANRPIMFHGQPGVGKTSTVKAFCRYENLGLITLNMSMFEPVDMRGLPSFSKDQLGNLVTSWARPNHLPQLERDGPKGILFFDEVNTARAMFPTLMQVFLERMSGEHSIMPGWLPVAAGNYRSAKGVAVDMPQPFNNRVAHFDYVPDWQYYTNELADEIGLHPVVKAYIRFRPWALFVMPGSEPEETDRPRVPADARAFPSPRSWEAVSDVLKQNPGDNLRSRLVSAIVGPEYSVDFEAFYLVYRDVTPISEIIAHPDTAKLPETMGMSHAVTAALASYANRGNVAAIMKYAKRMADAGMREYYVILGKDMVRRDPSLKTTGAYVQWATDNPDLLM